MICDFVHCFVYDRSSGEWLKLTKTLLMTGKKQYFNTLKDVDLYTNYWKKLKFCNFIYFNSWDWLEFEQI